MEKGQKGKQTMKNVVDPISNLKERGSRNHVVSGNAVAAYGQGGDEGEVGGSDQSGVELELDQLPRAHQDGPEFQYGISLTGSGRNRRFQVEEGNFRSVFARTHLNQNGYLQGI